MNKMMIYEKHTEKLSPSSKEAFVDSLHFGEIDVALCIEELKDYEINKIKLIANKEYLEELKKMKEMVM